MTRTTASGALIAAAFVLFAGSRPAAQLPPYGSAEEFRADLASRRSKTMEGLGAESVLVAWSAPARVYSNDVNYEFRQDSNLLYLTGLDQEDSVLVLVPGARTKKAVLFTKDADPQRELWNGHIFTAPEVTNRTGVVAVYPTSAFEPFMAGLFGGTGYQQTSEEAATEFGAFFDAMKDKKARLGILERVGGQGGRGAAANQPPPPGSHAAWAMAMQEKFAGVTAFSAQQILSAQREVKTPYEQKVLRRSAEISAEAHIEGMKAARPKRWEYEVEAAIEFWYLKNGAMSWGYPSIVGSGPNATTLHYESSTRQMEDGDLLLVDAAANFQGLSADITRTYPVNGKFSAAQRDIYELVLAAQEAAIKAAQLGKPLTEVTRACNEVFGAGLMKLGLIVEAKPEQIRMWFPHGPSHGIGLDVHDPLPTSKPLVAGNAFTIEPGLYIRADRLESLPKTPENAAVIEKIRPALEKYKNIGVRIEDSFLMTDTGVVNLSSKAPRKAADVEKVVGSGK